MVDINIYCYAQCRSIHQGGSVRQHKLYSRDWKIIKGLLCGWSWCLHCSRTTSGPLQRYPPSKFSIQPQLITTQISGSILLIHSEDIRLYSFNVKQYHFTTKHLKVMKLFRNKMTKSKKEKGNCKSQISKRFICCCILCPHSKLGLTR